MNTPNPDVTVETALRCVSLGLAMAVPVDIDTTAFAQDAANAVRQLHRAPTAERYAARADIAIPDEQPDEFEMIVSGAYPPPGQRLLIVVGLIWARRPWDLLGTESQNVMIDAHQAITAMCATHWPKVDPPSGLPIDAYTAFLASQSGQVLSTTNPEAAVTP